MNRTAGGPRIDIRMKRDALLSSPFFRAMRPEEIDAILGFAIERRFPRGATILNKGADGSNLMAVLAGRVRIGNVSAEGKEVTLNVIGPGEIFGEIALLDGKPRSADAVAVEDTTVLMVERRDFLPFLLRHDTLVERLLVVLCDRLRRTSGALEEIALFDLPARLARVLVKLADDYGRPDPAGGVRIGLKLSQRDLSTLVASSRESVNKQLRVWRTAAALDLRDGHLVLLRPQELQALME
jgi:CRP/FNR family transcriptional regulator, cyclic AMP receptor protein